MRVAHIQKSILTESPKIQKHKGVLDSLQNIKFFEPKDCPDDYVPVSFATTLRTARTNLVVEHEAKLKYENMAEHKPKEKTYPTYYRSFTLADEHINFNEVLEFMASLAVRESIDVSCPDVSKLLMTSQFIPIGLYNPDMGLCNPIFYSHVIFNDDLKSQLESALLEGNRLIPIQQIKRPTMNLGELLNHIIIISEVK